MTAEAYFGYSLWDLGSFLLMALGGWHVVFLLGRQARRDRAAAFDLGDYANQKRFVSRARFFLKPLMNKREFWLYVKLDTWVRRADKGFRLFAQVPLGEVLGCENDLAFRSINSKRCDFLVVDRIGRPVAVVEYHGVGHFQGRARERDEIKRIALANAGVPLVEVPVRYTKADLYARLDREVLGRLSASRPEGQETRAPGLPDHGHPGLVRKT